MHANTRMEIEAEFALENIAAAVGFEATGDSLTIEKARVSLSQSEVPEPVINYDG